MSCLNIPNHLWFPFREIWWLPKFFSLQCVSATTSPPHRDFRSGVTLVSSGIKHGNVYNPEGNPKYFEGPLFRKWVGTSEVSQYDSHFPFFFFNCVKLTGESKLYDLYDNLWHATYAWMVSFVSTSLLMIPSSFNAREADTPWHLTDLLIPVYCTQFYI